MSLQLAAQHMASRGRGPDTQLVHMAPQEVAGLHALAKAHGGSLTTNPDTGLPEAGFLSSILPMVIGAGLSVASGGMLTPLMAAGITGAGYGIATGSLQKGLMAGLGAYGGAGLAGGLMGAGAAGAAEVGAAGAGAGTNAGAASIDAAMANALPASSGVAPAAGLGSPTFAQASQAANAATANQAVNTAMNGALPLSSNAGFTGVATSTPMPTTFSDQMSQMFQGAKNLGTEAGREAFMGNAASKGVEAAGVGGGSGLMKYGLAAAAPVMFQEPKQAAPRPTDKPYEYSFDYGREEDPQAGYTGAATGQRTYFNPVYTRTAAGGGLTDIGPVQSMSDRNEAQTLMANSGQMFAEGGETKAVQPVEQDPYYTMSGQSGDAFKYLMGQGPRPAAPVQAPVAAPSPAAAQTAAPASSGLMSRWRSVLGAGSSNATMRPYTFDPVTGSFTALPIIEPVKPEPIATTTDFGSGNANGGLLSLARGGGISHLGDYSDGGRLLRGPGDGVSDDIPASIGDKRPARLADGEFVVPARIVSELGNGSTEAGARKLYAMMDRVQSARKKSIGKDRVAVNSRAEKLLPV